MDTGYLLARAKVGQTIDTHGAALLGFLTAAPASSNPDPVELVQFAQGRLPSSVEVRIHQVGLVGQLAHRFVRKEGLDNLYGAIEFRRQSVEGWPDGEPVFTIWFDDYGSYGVNGKAGYVSAAFPDSPQSGDQFRARVAAVLFLKVQDILLGQAVTHGS